MLATGTFHVTYPGEIFLINFDYNEYDNVIFSNGSNSNQTVDISINSEKKGIWYRLTGDKIGNKWLTADVYSYQSISGFLKILKNLSQKHCN